jgi:hypothetical protein
MEKGCATSQKIGYDSLLNRVFGEKGSFIIMVPAIFLSALRAGLGLRISRSRQRVQRHNVSETLLI